MTIPTILKGDDSGAILLNLADGRNYEGARLVVAYQGITRTFDTLTPGGTVQLVFTHDETATFALGTFPFLARLIGASGAVETVDNADMRVKVTDCLGEVNAGGGFSIVPGNAFLSAQDVGEMPTNSTVRQIIAKVNEIARALAAKSLPAIVATFMFAANGANVSTAKFGDIEPDTEIVTGVDFSGIGEGISRSDSTNIAEAVVLEKVPEWARRETPPITTETDPTVPAWAKAENPPEGMTDNAVVVNDGKLETKAGTAITAEAIGAASKELEGHVATLNTGYARLYDFATGSTNANFTATNYPPTKAEADMRTHYAPEPGMDFSTVPASLQLNEFRNGEWRTVMDTRDWPVWYYRHKETALTNRIAALERENKELKQQAEAAKAWGNFTADGQDNPFSDTIVMNRPNVWIMADFEWEKHTSAGRECFVIRSKNLAGSTGANDGGFLEICDAFGKPYMRVNKTAERFADAIASEIRFDQNEGAWYIVWGNETKPTKGGANTDITGAGNGKCIFFDETQNECPAVITWPTEDSRAGHWVMKAVPKNPYARMFFGAEIKVPGSDYVEFLKEASYPAGIRLGESVYIPQDSNGTLIWRKRND